MHHAFLYILLLKEIVIARQSYEVISLFSFLSSLTQTVAALQRNDAPLPGYGLGKVSFFDHPSVKTTTKFYNSII